MNIERVESHFIGTAPRFLANVRLARLPVKVKFRGDPVFLCGTRKLAPAVIAGWNVGKKI